MITLARRSPHHFLGNAMRVFLPILVTTAVSGCVTLPTADDLTQGPPPHLSADAPPGIVDGRSRFREYFCASSAECDRWLHELPGEAVMPPTMRDSRSDLQLLFVTGAFSECFGPSARPFADAISALAGGRDRFGTIVVGGRSGTAHNAAQISSYLGEHPPDPDMPLVLVGYSKGTSDILQFLVDYPEQAANITAVVSVAGSVGGSPLADRLGGIYDLTLSHLPLGHCEQGDGEVVSSLRTELRRAWLEENPLPTHIRYYSLAAFTLHDRVARALVPSWEMLLKYDLRNDGQLLPHDALVPHSTLLGYLNADHWAVTMELENDHEFFAGRKDPERFPHTALLDAILRVVGEDVAGPLTADAPHH